MIRAERSPSQPHLKPPAVLVRAAGIPELRLVERSVHRLLSSIPSSRLAGLGAVHLRCRASLTKAELVKRERQGKGRRLLGAYYPSSPGRHRAAIDLFVDEIVERWPRILFRVAFFADVAIARVLFHELGHHLDARVSPGVRSREGRAEEYRKELSKEYFRSKYRALAPLAFLLRRCRADHPIDPAT